MSTKGTVRGEDREFGNSGEVDKTDERLATRDKTGSEEEWLKGQWMDLGLNERRQEKGPQRV